MFPQQKGCKFLIWYLGLAVKDWTKPEFTFVSNNRLSLGQCKLISQSINNYNGNIDHNQSCISILCVTS